MLWLLLTLGLGMVDEPAGSFLEGKTKKEGFFDLFWDDAQGKLYLAIDSFDDPFLFVNSLVTGLGSNDIGLDRGQLGDTRVVSFKRVGNKVFLVQPNLRYRALSDNPQERRAVAESFAYATLWGTTVVAEEAGRVFVDLSSFVLRDEHGIVERLKRRKEGQYKLDVSRSYYFPQHIKSFPDNTEIEVVLTFEGQPSGSQVNTVAPTPSAISLHQRYSFVRLPENDYQSRAFHPRSGAFYLEFWDYAAPLDEDLNRKIVPRHHLRRKDPRAARSELVEPLVYYVDAGAPAEIKQALIEGASWWNEAFEAAGIVNGFRVEELPPDADPMDVRYNVIQWVHRSTRGWSYGASVIDPRTGEIIKGHVTLGSLRVRQDRLIFEGVVPYEERDHPKTNPVKLALARIRQLSAHEVGHTLGISHNFAASNFERASVMDYPAPLIRLKDGKPDLSQVYAEGIGEWDKLAIRYLYGVFENETEGLATVLHEAEERGLAFLADKDGRHPRTMHPLANVWDNGTGDPVAEFARVVEVRRYLLDHFGTDHLAPGKTFSRLEEVLVPVYLHHRFQLSACVKPIGGASFDYADNDGRAHYQPVPRTQQQRALDQVLATLEASFLDLPQHLRDLIPPAAYGYEESREYFDRRTWPAFDELSLAETGIQLTLDTLLQPERLNRLYNQRVNDPGQLGVVNVLSALLAPVGNHAGRNHREAVIHRQVNYKVVQKLTEMVGTESLREDVRAQIRASLQALAEDLTKLQPESPEYRAHYRWLRERLERSQKDDGLFQPSSELKIPPGSPIGN